MKVLLSFGKKLNNHRVTDGYYYEKPVLREG
jgi:hypothetical protein